MYFQKQTKKVTKQSEFCIFFSEKERTQSFSLFSHSSEIRGVDFGKKMLTFCNFFPGLNIFCYIDVPLPSGQKERWYVELERDVYNKESLRIPMLEDGRGPADEEEEISKFPAKAYNHLDLNLAAKFTVVNTELGE